MSLRVTLSSLEVFLGIPVSASSTKAVRKLATRLASSVATEKASDVATKKSAATATKKVAPPPPIHAGLLFQDEGTPAFLNFTLTRRNSPGEKSPLYFVHLSFRAKPDLAPPRLLRVRREEGATVEWLMGELNALLKIEYYVSQVRLRANGWQHPTLLAPTLTLAGSTMSARGAEFRSSSALDPIRSIRWADDEEAGGATIWLTYPSMEKLGLNPWHKEGERCLVLLTST